MLSSAKMEVTLQAVQCVKLEQIEQVGGNFHIILLWSFQILWLGNFLYKYKPYFPQNRAVGKFKRISL